jgi:molybdopterin synthase catalytic subunit
VGEAAIVVRVEAKHRAEAFGMLAAFMDRLKQDVPIWKVKP